MIAVIGDTQSTSWPERALLRREQNHCERELLIQSLSAMEIDLLIHLGDMVVKGSSEKAWREFDLLFTPIFTKGVRFLPLLGNHEYWGSARRRRALLQSRFPELALQPWQALICGNLGVIAVDSNVSQYTGAAWAQRAEWFENALDEFEKETSVTAVIVCSHHPPFTNSAVLKRANYLEKRFLPAFFAAPKTRVFLSGHVHGYERFLVQDKTFIVSGGGGGPRLPLRHGERRRFEDLFSATAARPFHYMLLSAETDRLHIDAMGLGKAQSHVHVIDTFEIFHTGAGN